MMFCFICKVFSTEEVCWNCGEVYGMRTSPDWAAPHVHIAARDWYNVGGRSMKIDHAVENLI